VIRPKVETIMTRKVVSVDPECPIDHLLGKLHAYGISCVLVCEEGRPGGIITEREAVAFAHNLLSEKGDDRRRARDLMSSPLTTICEEDSIDAAVELVLDKRISHLPVVDAEGCLVGLVTTTDLLRACQA
jgi:CBS domain-containing protein